MPDSCFRKLEKRQIKKLKSFKTEIRENCTFLNNLKLRFIQELQGEIAELVKRLEVADREKAQAGELGLHLLKEKEQLEQTHEASTNF
jgi:hypothetical protein